tara:strand:- start:374 stop:799 length:426 start_codon:yes stop_codon:yes gene_type:complete
LYPLDCRIAANDAAVRPLPREETTPPVIKIIFVLKLVNFDITIYSVSGTIGLFSSMSLSIISSISVLFIIDFSFKFPDKIANKRLFPKNKAAIIAVSFVRKLAELLPVSIPEKLPPPIPPNAPPSLRWISMITINTIANRA